MSGGSIGTIIGGIIGAVVGTFLGGNTYAGFMVGAALGGAIGGYLDQPKGPHLKGPRLEELQQQTATYGAFIPRLYGTVALFGNVFWIENNKLKEVATTTTQGGKGGPPQSSQTTFKYYATFAVGLCEGPIFGIKRIWISGKLWYNKGTVHESTLNASNDKEARFRLFLGTETQLPEPRMEADVGVANCPGMRGLAYILFYDLDVGPYGNSLAGVQVKIEVIKTGVLAYVNNLKWSSTDTSDSYSVAVNGNFAYVGRSSSIAIYDIANKEKPKFLGSVLSEKAFRMRVYKEWLYVCTEAGGHVQALDISAPQSPNIAWSIVADGNYPFGIDVADDMLCVAVGGFVNNLILYDVSIPIAPLLLSSTVIGGKPYSIKKVGDYIYLGKDTAATFVIYDISNPYSPILLSTTAAGGTVYDIDVQGIYVYINILGHIKIYDVTNKTSPVLIKTLVLGYVKGFCIDGNYLVVNDANQSLGAARIRIFDISVPALAAEIANIAGGNHTGASFPANILKIKNYILVAENNSLTAPQSALRVYFFSPQFLSATPTLASIVNEECLKSNLLTAPDIDTSQLTDLVRGYRVSSMSAIRSSIEPLQGAWPFDVIQDGYKIKFVARGGASVATISHDKLDARAEVQKPGVQITKIREMDSVLPAKVSIKYLDFNREYDTGEQYYERINTDAINITDMELPIVMIASEAAGKAQTLCYLYWLERYDIAFNLPPEYNHLQPADVLTLTAPGQSYNLRIKQINYTQDGRLEIQAKYNTPAIYTPTEIGEDGNIPPDTLDEHGDTLYELLDIPLVDDALDMPGFPVAMTGNLEGWPGGILSRSDDGGATYNSVQGFNQPGSTMGEATNIIGLNAGVLLDKANILNVALNQGTLSSITELQMLNGGNHFAYGLDGRWEIFGAQNCVLQADGSYNLSDMLRGRFGTEQYTGNHAVGDKVVLLTSTTMAFVQTSSAMIGLPRHYKAVTSGQALDTVTAKSFVYKAVNLECLSPVYLKASRNPVTGDITIAWTRRGRISPAWRDLVDVPVGETSEAYEVEIYSDNTFTALKRTLTSLSQSVVYTSIDFSSDFGSAIGDLFYNNTLLTLHCGGVNNSAVFTDTSLSPKAVTVIGDAKISTAQSKFGGSSGLFDGNGDLLTIMHDNIFNIGSGNLTIEMWVYRTASSAVAQVLVDKRANNFTYSPYSLTISPSNNLNFYCSFSGTSWAVGLTGTATVPLNTWTHVAAVKNGSVYTLYQAGISVASVTVSGALMSNTTVVCVGGIADNTSFFFGYMDEIQIINAARYTGNFATPNAPFADYLPSNALPVKIYQLSQLVGRGYPGQSVINF